MANRGVWKNTGEGNSSSGKRGVSGMGRRAELYTCRDLSGGNRGWKVEVYGREKKRQITQAGYEERNAEKKSSQFPRGRAIALSGEGKKPKMLCSQKKNAKKKEKQGDEAFTATEKKRPPLRAYDKGRDRGAG